MRIRNRLLCTMVGFLAIVTAGFGWLCYRQQKQALIGGADRDFLYSTVEMAAAVLLAGALVSLRLANSLSRPIERITQAAEDIAAGRFDLEKPVQGPREIESLGASIASLGHAIHDRIHDLHQSREDLRITLRSIGDAVIATDVAGCVLWMNPVAETLTGWPQAQAAAQPLADVFRIVNAHTGAVVESPVTRVLSEGRAVGLANHTVLVARDGTQRQIADSAAPIQDDHGQTQGVVLVFRDVTAQYAQDRALEDSERRFRELFEHMSSGVAIYEAVDDGRDFLIRDINRVGAKSSRIDRDAVVGKSVQEAFPGVRQMGLLEVFQRVWRTGQPESVPATVYRDEHILEWYENYIFRLPSGEVIAIFDDVTHRKQSEAERQNLERQVQQAQKLESLGVLAGGIAHDFNNLLVAILGNADLALSELSPASTARAGIIEIVTASRRAAELCKQMLAYSGKGRFSVEPLDTSEVVAEMAHMLEVSISKKAILKYHFTPHLPPVMADATQLRQVIMNLIINASEAIGEKSGVISVSTGVMECDREYLHEAHIDEGLPEGLYVTLDVSDTGCGMDEATRACIFDPFFTTKFTGRGLGLAAVLGIVRGHKGAIKVYSEKGKGTTFKMLLPAALDAMHAARATSQAEPIATWQGGGAILLVDDEDNVRTPARRMLMRLGFEVLTANDGLEALPIFRENAHRIAGVVLDMTMPHMDGAETFRELRRIQPNVRVLLSSGYNEQELSERFAGKGLAGFLQKPYTLAALSEALRKAL